MKIPENLSEVTKWQNAHISLKWCWIQKIKALYFLQLWKLKKRKCTYFRDQRSTWWVMIILLFHEDTGHPIILVPVKKLLHTRILLKSTKQKYILDPYAIHNENPTQFHNKIENNLIWVCLIITSQFLTPSLNIWAQSGRNTGTAPGMLRDFMYSRRESNRSQGTSLSPIMDLDLD